MTITPSDPAILVYVINVDWYFDLHWLQRARAILDKGVQVHIIMGMTDPEIQKKITEIGFICHAWNIDRRSVNPWNNFLRFIELYRILKRLAPNLIHAITIKPNIYVGLLAHLVRKPYILSVTGTGVIFSGKSMKVRIMRPLVRFLYKCCNQRLERRMVFENREDQEYFVSTGLCQQRQAQTILGAGVDTALFNYVPENKQQPVKILFASRLLWDKGLRELIEAGKLLRQQSLEFSLEVAGIIDTSTLNAIPEPMISQWTEQGLMHWLGTVKDMPTLIGSSNIVVLPSFYGEGVPRILIEAAASGRAIVTTDMPGCREIGRHQVNALVVMPQNVEALAKALQILITDADLRMRLGQQGRQIVEQEFSEGQVIEETLTLYQEFLS